MGQVQCPGIGLKTLRVLTAPLKHRSEHVGPVEEILILEKRIKILGLKVTGDRLDKHFCAFEVLQVCLCMIEGFPSCLVLLMMCLFHPDQGSRADRSGLNKLRLQTQLGLVNNRTPSLAHTYSCPITSGTRLTVKELRKEKRIREFAFDSSLRDCVCYL